MVFVDVCGSFVPPFFTADAGGKVRASKLGVPRCGVIFRTSMLLEK